MSGVKVTNERSAPPIRAVDSVEGEVDGDNEDWEPGGSGVSELDQWKQPVRVATTANVTIATALNAGDTIDGVTLVAGDRVLVKDQTADEENGIYVAGTTPERAVDLDEDDEVLGAVVYVVAGTTNAGTAWAVTNTAATVVDTDAITWAAFGGGGSGSVAASAVSVADAGGYYAGTDVEAVLQEIPSLFVTRKDGGLETVDTVVSAGATETIDLGLGNWKDMTLTANCVVTVTGFTSGKGCSALVKVTQDGTGGWAITWDSDVLFQSGVNDQPDQNPGDVTFFILASDEGNGTIYGFRAGGGATAIEVKDEGTTLTSTPTSIDFVGAGVTATHSGDAVTVTVSATSGYREVLMASGITDPPDPMVSSDGTDWLYGTVS